VTKGNSEIIFPVFSSLDNLEEQQNYPANSKQIYTVHEDLKVRRPSTRTKKLPLTRNGDFYGRFKLESN
jgi:hypothetical protein